MFFPYLSWLTDRNEKGKVNYLHSLHLFIFCIYRDIYHPDTISAELWDRRSYRNRTTAALLPLLTAICPNSLLWKTRTVQTGTVVNAVFHPSCFLPCPWRHGRRVPYTSWLWCWCSEVLRTALEQIFCTIHCPFSKPGVSLRAENQITPRGPSSQQGFL